MSAGLVRRGLGAVLLAALLGLTSCSPIFYAQVFNETDERIVVDSAWFARIAPHRAKRVAFGYDFDRVIKVGDCQVHYYVVPPRRRVEERNRAFAFQIEPDLTIYVLEWDARAPLKGEALAAVPERMRIRPTDTVCEEASEAVRAARWRRPYAATDVVMDQDRRGDQAASASSDVSPPPISRAISSRSFCLRAGRAGARRDSSMV